METVSVTEAKASLSRLLERARGGERIAIGRRGVPEAYLVPAEEDVTPRRLGVLADDDDGPYWMSDDFDEPDEEIADLFENSVIFPGDDA